MLSEVPRGVVMEACLSRGAPREVWCVNARLPLLLSSAGKFVNVPRRVFWALISYNNDMRCLNRTTKPSESIIACIVHDTTLSISRRTKHSVCVPVFCWSTRSPP